MPSVMMLIISRSSSSWSRLEEPVEAVEPVEAEDGDVGYRSDKEGRLLLLLAAEPPLSGLDSVEAVVSQPIKARRGSRSGPLAEEAMEGEVAPEDAEVGEEDGGRSKLAAELEAATVEAVMTPTVSRILAREIGGGLLVTTSRSLSVELLLQCWKLTLLALGSSSLLRLVRLRLFSASFCSLHGLLA